MAKFNVALNFLKKQRYIVKLAEVSTKERGIDNVSYVIIIF